MRRTQSVPGVRPGASGHLDHQAKVTQLEQQAMREARPGEAVLVQRRVQGHATRRTPDVQIVDSTGKTRKIFEAERLPTSGRNAAREADYRRLGIPFETHELD
jgi:hypothetical protein